VDSSACVDPLKFPGEGFRSTGDLPVAANTCMRFSKPVRFTLKTYQTYRWTVTVNQSLARTLTVENQVGEPVIDPYSRKAVVYVSASQRLNDVRITQFTPEGEGTTLTPDPSTVTDFTRPRSFRVSKRYANGKVKDMGTWVIDVQQTESLGQTQMAEVWARKALLTGTLPQGATLTVRYKASNQNAWTELDSEAITLPNATSFRATLTGLTDGTTYDWQTEVNGQIADSGTFTTESIIQLQNMNFDTWTQDSDGDRWYPNATAADSYWATGNSGLSIANKDNVTQPTADAISGRDRRDTGGSRRRQPVYRQLQDQHVAALAERVVRPSVHGCPPHRPQGILQVFPRPHQLPLGDQRDHPSADPSGYRPGPHLRAPVGCQWPGDCLRRAHREQHRERVHALPVGHRVHRSHRGPGANQHRHHQQQVWRRV
jgi:hypothetical protein